MAGRVDGKVAIVTGAARGRGRSHCLVLAREGANIAAVDICRDLDQVSYSLAVEDELSSVVNEIRALGRQAIGIRCDVTKGDEVEQMVERVVDEFGKVDILVNNAGITGGAPITEMTEEHWDRVLDVCLKSQFLCCKYVLPHMIKQQSGKIINIGSLAGREGHAGASAYSAAKAGVHNFTHALAKELGPYNINVNCVAPGVINTAMIRGAAPEAAARLGIKPEEVYGYMCKMYTILGREQTEEDVSNAVVFLASEEARNIDGSVIYVDGGHLMV